MNKKLLITLGIIVGAIYAIGNASITLNFTDLNIQSFGNKFSLVHFTAPGNNFVGSVFRLSSKSIPGITLTLSSTSKTCTKQLKGLYFNSQRGQRLRPLDSETLALLQQQNVTYAGLSITGGLYTSCENTSPYSVFGSIEYTRGGTVSHVVAGTQLNYNQNKITPSFVDSFQYFDNKIPIGYIYDSNGGIGFVGGSLIGHQNLINFLNNGGSINSGFTYSGNTIISNNGGRSTIIPIENNAMETMRNLIIQGSVGLSKSINESERLSLLGNFENKTVIYNGSDINSSTLINIAKQKAQTLCQGKTKYMPDILGSSPENIICIENKNIKIQLSNVDTYTNKTIIVKSGNVVLEGGMIKDSPALDLFVDKGILYLPSTLNTRQTFNQQGFPDSSNTANSGLYLKGNFIINGLIIGGGAGSETGFNHKLHLQGKITTLNTPVGAGTGRISQINSMLGYSYDTFINLQNVFTRKCTFAGIGNDGTLCDTGGVISTTPLVILNGNYPSNILQ